MYVCRMMYCNANRINSSLFKCLCSAKPVSLISGLYALFAHKYISLVANGIVAVPYTRYYQNNLLHFKRASEIPRKRLLLFGLLFHLQTPTHKNL
jgi:hypothetical protein